MHDGFAYVGGIDFSGAKEPLSNLWSAVGREQHGKLHVLALCPHAFRQDLAHHVGGGWRKLLKAEDDAAILWGADFPFGLPGDAVSTLEGLRERRASIDKSRREPEAPPFLLQGRTGRSGGT